MPNKTKATTFRVGPQAITYSDGKGGEKTAEPGDIVGDIPGAKWLAFQGWIEPVKEGE